MKIDNFPSIHLMLLLNTRKIPILYLSISQKILKFQHYQLYLPTKTQYFYISNKNN